MKKILQFPAVALSVLCALAVIAFGFLTVLFAAAGTTLDSWTDE
jgi:hypothetical protein